MRPTPPDEYRPNQKTAIALLLALPIAVFYFLLARAAVNLPFLDDYPCILEFLNLHVSLPTFRAKAAHLLMAQHNEYKLIFENCVVVLQRACLGHVNFLLLMAFGNAFVLLIFLALWRVSLVRVNPWQRALLIAPAAYLLFQLQYASTLDWAMGSLQNLPVLFFALLCLTLLSYSSRWSFAGASAAMLLAVASSGNGFLAAVTGAILLIEQKQFRRVAAWICLSMAAIAGYFYRYNFHSHQSSQRAGGSIFASLHAFSLGYVLSFLGASAAGTVSVAPAIAVGAALCGVFCWMLKQRYAKANPALFYFFLFLLLSACAVAGLRGDSGVAQSLISRYRMYSNLALVVAYLFIIEQMLQMPDPKRHVRAVLAAALLFSMVFCVVSDVAGNRFLLQRSREITNEMRAWEYPERAPSKPPIDATTDPMFAKHRAAGIYRPVPAVLAETRRLGIYNPTLQP